MTEKEFLAEFHRLEGGFPFLARDLESRKAREAAYWMVLRACTAEDWKCAVTLINENWETDTFPIPSVVRRYVEKERNRRASSRPKEDCRECDGTGWTAYTDKHGVWRVRECGCLKVLI